MKRQFKNTLAILLSLCTLATSADAKMATGDPGIKSITKLEFSPEGILFIGDAHNGEVVAIDLAESKADNVKKAPKIEDLEGQVAALLGAKASDILIHDMAVNPLSKNVYLSVNRGRALVNYSYYGTSYTPDNASVLIRVNLDSSIEQVDLSKVKYAKAALPNPIAKDRNYSYGNKSSMRANAITYMAYEQGTLYVAGMSNEEFTSAMWKLPYPFTAQVRATTLEVFHAAHNQNETHAPVRAFLPFEINTKGHLLMAYTCTPLVTVPLDALKDNGHVKGRTIAELGSGNIPIDMIRYKHKGEDRIMISNTELPLMTFKAEDINNFKGSIAKQVEGYTAGVKYEAKGRSGVQQIDNFNDELIIMTKRNTNGKLVLTADRTVWL